MLFLSALREALHHANLQLAVCISDWGGNGVCQPNQLYQYILISSYIYNMHTSHKCSPELLRCFTCCQSWFLRCILLLALAWSSIALILVSKLSLVNSLFITCPSIHVRHLPGWRRSYGGRGPHAVDISRWHDHGESEEYTCAFGPERIDICTCRAYMCSYMHIDHTQQKFHTRAVF